MVLESRDRIKKTENLKEAFSVPDLCEEYAEESYILRQALKISRGKYNIECHLSNKKLVMTDSSLAYSAEQLPDYLNVKKSKLEVIRLVTNRLHLVLVGYFVYICVVTQGSYSD